MAEGKKANNEKKLVSRRSFLVGTGAVIAAGALAACSPKTITNTVTETMTKTTTTTAPPITKEAVTTTVPATFAASTKYLVVDSKKCCGCQSCMLTCSMVHEGIADTSLSRIQIVQSAFMAYPEDLKIYQCRQCTSPLCVQNCPVGACYIDTANGNVRVIDQTKCIGCQTCIKSCPHTPHRTVWNSATNKSSKCDLCLNTPYWTGGGPNGKQACVSVCTMDCLSVVNTAPSQTDSQGYEVNLRTGPAPTPTTP